MHIISRGLFNIEELEKMEVKETVKVDVSRFKMPLVYPSLNIDKLSIFFFYISADFNVSSNKEM